MTQRKQSGAESELMAEPVTPEMRSLELEKALERMENKYNAAEENRRELDRKNNTFEQEIARLGQELKTARTRAKKWRKKYKQLCVSIVEKQK